MTRGLFVLLLKTMKNLIYANTMKVVPGQSMERLFQKIF